VKEGDGNNSRSHVKKGYVEFVEMER